MARLVTSGFEIYSSTSETTTSPDGLNTGVASCTCTRDTAVKRSGAASAKAITTAGTGLGYWRFAWTGFTGQYYFARAYYRANRPTSACAIMEIGGLARVQLNTDGTVSLQTFVGAAWTTQGSASTVALDDNTSFYMVQLRVFQSASAGADEVELILENTTVASWTGTFGVATAPATLDVGWVTSPGATSKVIYVDDVAVNDGDAIANTQYGFPGPASVVLLKPVSDSQDGSWRGGADTTGIDLSLAVTNTPPQGSNVGSNTTTIESNDSSGDNTTDEYRANLTTYTNAGILATDTVKVLVPWCNHGEQAGTNTKAGKFGLQANPASAGGGGETTFNYGNDGGASGAWPTGWAWKSSTVAYDPSVTLGSNPVLAIRKTDTGTRVAQVDFMGVYCEYLVGATEAETRERTQMLVQKARPLPEVHTGRTG